MAWYECIGGSNEPVMPSKFWIFNPDEADALRTVSTQNGAYVPYITQINRGNTSGYPNMYGTTNFGGTTLNVIQRGGVEVGAVTIPIKIPHGVYNKLYARVQVVADGTGWLKASIVLASEISFDGSGGQTNKLKDVILVDTSKTTDQINSQSGVIINSTNNSLLSAQVVEIDISNLDSDFYFGWWNCDRRISFRSVYCE